MLVITRCGFILSTLVMPRKVSPYGARQGGPRKTSQILAKTFSAAQVPRRILCMRSKVTPPGGFRSNCHTSAGFPWMRLQGKMKGMVPQRIAFFGIRQVPVFSD